MFIRIVFLFLYLPACLQAQEHSKKFDYDGIEGVIFNIGFPINYFGIADSLRWEIDSSAFLSVDNKVFKFFKSGKRKYIGGQGTFGCPVIYFNQKEYYRQVFCYVDNEGNKLVRINYIHKGITNLFPNWEKEFVSIIGGCSSYFTILYSIEKRKVISFAVG